MTPTTKALSIFGLITAVTVAVSILYLFKQSRGGFEYGIKSDPKFHVPDRANPVLFHLRKKGAFEPLVRRQIREALAYDRGSYYYDVQGGGITQQAPPSAGLKITFTRTLAPQGEPFDWTWKIEGVNAALQETTEEFPFLAPEAGYVAAWETSRSAQDPSFRQDGKVQFYLRTNDGRYARADMELSQRTRAKEGRLSP